MLNRNRYPTFQHHSIDFPKSSHTPRKIIFFLDAFVPLWCHLLTFAFPMTETPNSPVPLHQLNPLERFSHHAEDYAKYRPSYPQAAIDFIVEGWTDLTQITAADIGAGTGISSRLLAERGINVKAIEPNAAMREVAVSHPLVEFLTGTAEEIPLCDRSLDLVISFQAFHWFNSALALPEFARILKPQGRLAVAWNERDRCDPFTQQYRLILRKCSQNHPAGKRKTAFATFQSSDYFCNLQHQIFPYRQAVDFRGLLGRAESTSYVPKSGEAKDRLVQDLSELYEQFKDDQGLVYLVYATNVYRMEKAHG